MASLLLPDDDPSAPAPLLQLPDERPPSLQPDPRVDALGQTFQAIADYMAQKQQEGVDAGNWEGGWPWEGGHPTWQAAKGAVDAYAHGLQAGTLKGPSFNVYHGSPYEFAPTPKNPLGEFDPTKIHTGEGSTAFSQGVYTSEGESVASGYRPPGGSMYEVKVNADPARFLHWEQPIGEQHPDVQAALKDLGVPDNPSMSGRMAHDSLVRSNMTNGMKFSDASAATAQQLNDAGIPGVRYIDAPSRVTTERDMASAKQAIADRQSQIADIQTELEANKNNPNLLPRYFAARQEEIAQHQQVIDQIKERMSEGTHNAVVFDPSTMEIIRRYGLAGLMLGGGGLLSPDKQEQ